MSGTFLFFGVKKKSELDFNSIKKKYFKDNQKKGEE